MFSQLQWADDSPERPVAHFPHLPDFPGHLHNRQHRYLGDVEAPRRTRVFLIRDPFNHLASTVRMGQRRGDWTLIHKPTDTGPPTAEGVARWAARWKQYARECLRIIQEHPPGEVAIHYNRWLSDAAYRDDLFEWLGLDRRSDDSMNRVPRQGAGSSFEHRKLDGKARQGSYTERWKTVQDEAWFRNAFEDEELVALSVQLFGHLPGTEVLTATRKEAAHA